MKLKVLRFSSQEDSTSGLLFLEKNDKLEFLCYTLEDEYRDTKKYGETRIPAGTYNLTLRQEGGYDAKYSKRFADIHKGMLWVRSVPGFEYILIHCGNTDEHTAGCLLLGDSQKNNILTKDGFIGGSTQAYKRVYPIIANELDHGNSVTIEYINHA